MRIEIIINNIKIAEEITDTNSEIEIKNTVDKITNAILAANRIMNPEPEINIMKEVNTTLGLKSYETNPALLSDKPASEKQIKLLKKLGYAGRIDNLSCREVANIIEDINRKNGYDYEAFKAGRGIG